MFPVFSVLFRVCSQLKPLKRRAVPTVPSCFASDYFLKCDWATSKSSERSGNTGNSRNDALYQSAALFPVEGRSGNSGNRRSPITFEDRPLRGVEDSLPVRVANRKTYPQFGGQPHSKPWHPEKAISLSAATATR